jgi:MoaA/NifB/PqqE/SkfB family radical SAM enzyme
VVEVDPGGNPVVRPNGGLHADVELSPLGTGTGWRENMIRLRHLKQASRFVAHRFRELHPFEVEACLLNACNTRCVYCTCPDVKTTLLTKEQWRTVIRRLGTLGTMRIKFQGGEPTISPDFRELCAEAKAAGMITATVSNGLIIPDRPELLDYLDEFVVSLDSPNPETNDRQRGEGYYDRAIKAIDISLERGIRTFINMVVTRDNLQDLEAMLEFCEARGVLMNAQAVVSDGRYYDDKARVLELTPEQMRTVHMRLVEWKRQGRGLLYSAGTYKKAADWPDHSIIATRIEGESSCMAGKDYIRIEANGDVLPCVLHVADFTPKNILRDGLEESLRHVRKHNCGDCWRVHYNERKAVFGLRPSALWEVVRRG